MEALQSNSRNMSKSSSFSQSSNDSTKSLGFKQRPPMKTKKERREELAQASSIVQETATRKWMERRGMGKFVQFNDE